MTAQDTPFRTKPMQSPESQFSAVVDTNVVLDVYSCHDVAKRYDEVHSRLGIAAVDEASVVYRRTRARESLLLAIYFNKIGASTFSLHHESVELLTTRVPPAPGGQTLESDFTTVFLYFVKDYVLPEWESHMPTEPGDASGNDADRLLVEFAKEHALPLITNEGFTQRGVVEEKMRKRAREAGVSVFSPRQFYLGKIDEAAEIEAFLSRFRDQVPRYLEARKRELGEDNVAEVLSWVYGYYRLILKGEAEGRDIPVSVSLVGP
jgi:hypothetical protein